MSFASSCIRPVWHPALSSNIKDGIMPTRAEIRSKWSCKRPHGQNILTGTVISAPRLIITSESPLNEISGSRMKSELFGGIDKWMNERSIRMKGAIAGLGRRQEG